MNSGERRWKHYTTGRGRNIVREEIDDAFKKLPRPPRIELEGVDVWPKWAGVEVLRRG